MTAPSLPNASRHGACGALQPARGAPARPLARCVRVLRAAAAVGAIGLALAACGDARDRPLAAADAAVPGSAAAVTAASAVTSAPAPVDPPATPGARLDSVPVDGLALAVPLYPGAAVEGDSASRIELPTGSTLMLTLRSADPMPQVAGFYRDAMRARAEATEGAEFADLGDAAGTGAASLVLADTAAGQAVQVQVSATPTAGSLIQIVDTRRMR